MRLKTPYGLVLESLGKPGANVPFIMPKRVAATSADKQIDDYTGSGPFIFKKDEWRPGEKVVYVRNPRYVPRADPATGTAGGKIARWTASSGSSSRIRRRRPTRSPRARSTTSKCPPSSCTGR